MGWLKPKKHKTQKIQTHFFMKLILMKILHKHTPKNTQKLKKTETVFAAQKLEYFLWSPKHHNNLR